MPLRSIVSRAGLAAVLFVAACTRDSTTATDPSDGRINFSYAGAESGRFVARGDSQTVSGREYAFASLYPTNASLPTAVVINGSMRLANGSDARVTIFAPPVLGRSSCPPGLYGCVVSARLVLNVRSSAPAEARVYDTRLIEVNLTEVNPQRVRGTFTMTAEEVAASGYFNGRTIEVRTGEFDVPLVSSAATPRALPDR